MARPITITIFWCSLLISGYSQQPHIPFNDDKVALIDDKPTVYLTFERDGRREPVHASESSRGIWLRLHNNARWAINFCTVSLYIPPKAAPFKLADGRSVPALREGTEVSVCHGVDNPPTYEPVHERTRKRKKLANSSKWEVGYDRGDVFSSAWLAPGGSIVFSIPSEHLSGDLTIFLRFKYEWEYGTRTFRRDEPEHRVYFRAIDLPKNFH